MINTLYMKRGTRAELDASAGLATAEPGFCTDTGELFVGSQAVNPQVEPGTIMGNAGSNKAQPLAMPAADALEFMNGQTKPVAVVVTLPASDWVMNEDGIYVQNAGDENITATCHVLASPVPASYDLCSAATLRAIEQAEGTLKFAALELPEKDIAVTLLIFQY